MYECGQAYGAHTAQTATGGYDAQQTAAYSGYSAGYGTTAAPAAYPAATAATATASYGGYEDTSGYNGASRTGAYDANAAARYHPYSR